MLKCGLRTSARQNEQGCDDSIFSKIQSVENRMNVTNKTILIMGANRGIEGQFATSGTERSECGMTNASRRAGAMLARIRSSEA